MTSVGDITPVEGVPAHVKHQLEEEAMDAFLNEMLGGDGNKEAKERFRSLWDVSAPCLSVLTSRNTKHVRRPSLSWSR